MNDVEVIEPQVMAPGKARNASRSIGDLGSEVSPEQGKPSSPRVSHPCWSEAVWPSDMAKDSHGTGSAEVSAEQRMMLELLENTTT